MSINGLFIGVMMMCSSKKTTTKSDKTPEPVKPKEPAPKEVAKPKEVPPTPTPTPAEPVAPKVTTPTPKPDAQKSIKSEYNFSDTDESIRTCDCTSGGMKKGYRKDNATLWAEQIVKVKIEDIVAEYHKNLTSIDPSQPCKAFEANIALNRYKDIKCLDNNRVIVKNHKTDYYHANLVETYQQCTLAQTPMKETTETFWKMALEQNVKMIVMLCLFVEGGVEQCSQYYPDSEGETEKYGDIEVKFEKKRDHPVPDVTWNVIIVNDQSKKDGKKKKIHIINVPWWPNNSVPTDLQKSFDLFFWVKSRTTEHPIIITCDSGNGRSAAFVAIHVARCAIDKDPKNTVVDAVKTLRTTIYGAIRNEEEYMFLYAFLLKFFCENYFRCLYGYTSHNVKPKTIEPFLKEYEKYAKKKQAERKEEEMKKREKEKEADKEEKEKEKSEKSKKEEKKDKEKSVKSEGKKEEKPVKSKEKEGEKEQKSEEKKEKSGKEKE